MNVTDGRPVVITGAAGFIGSNLVERMLSDGLTVIGIDNFCDFYDPAAKRRNIADAEEHGAFTLVEVDIRDRGAIMEIFKKYRPGVVVHLAAMAGVRPSIERPEYYTEVNINGTVNLLDAAVATGVEKFIFASSSSVYGNNEKVPFSESDSVDRPISPYAATKKAGELICHSYHHLHKLPMTCLRFFTVFGPRQRPDLAISKFLQLVDDEQTIPMFGDGSSSRDYTYVDDIVQGILAAVEHCKGYEIYNLGNSSPMTLTEMIETIGQVVGKDVKVEKLPMQAGDVDRTWADVSKSGRELGYEPRISLKEGITRQWAWMRRGG